MLLKTGEYSISNQYEMLETKGIGSCVVICISDSRSEWMAMAHMLLPNQTLFDERDIEIGKSPEYAIPEMIHVLLSHGCLLKNLKISLIGAGDMFKHTDDNFLSSIGKNILQQTLIEISNVFPQPKISQSTGGNLGKSVKFYREGGKIEILDTKGEISWL